MAKKKTSKLTPQEQVLLQEAVDVLDTLSTKGWGVILTFLQHSITWPDPKNFKNREEIVVPYSESYGAAELLKKLVEFTGSREEVIKALNTKIELETDLPNYAIGD